MKTQPIVPAALVLRSSPQGRDLPWSPGFDDVYHAEAGAFEQARHVFLAGNGLPARWQGRESFVVLETGFGLGNNFLATWDAWQADAQRCGRLVFISIEKHPFTRDDLRRAHAGSPRPDLAAQLADAWPPLMPNLHQLDFEGGRVRLLLGLGDVADLLPQLLAEVDAFFLDGFAPAKNPKMWDERLLERLGRLAAEGATAATWSVARGVRDGLAAGGFVVERRPGFAGKRDMVAAHHAPHFRPPAPPGGLLRPALAAGERRALVIGAGLAGAAAAFGLAEQGWACTVLDRAAEPAQGASGNPGGLFHGVMHPDDGPHARAHRAAALATASLVAPWLADGSVTGQLAGLLRLDTQGDDEALRLVDRLGLPADYLRWLTREQAVAAAGIDVPSGGWWFAQGGWLHPGDYVRALLRAARAEVLGNREVRGLRREHHRWQALDAQGQVLGEAPVLVLANGLGAAGLLAAGALAEAAPLSAVRGQVTLLEPGRATLPRVPVAGGGYVLALPGGRLLCGATSQDGDVDAALREADHLHNLRQALRLGALHGEAEDWAGQAHGRVGWRATTPDRLPLIGAVPDSHAVVRARGEQVRLLPRLRDGHGGLYLLAGLGSRGIGWTALAARLLASWVTGAPCPVELDLRDALDPARFQARRVRQAARRASAFASGLSSENTATSDS
ncbi:MAG: FAD-dependent oxidoreductase [Aquabacterium sp.]|nr:MAG: FAD-dependent oxidoreductase [Aquabacterium sp.]